MTVLAVLLMLAASARVGLVDEIYRIPAGDWRYVELELRQVPVAVICHFEGAERTRPVRLALMHKRDINRLRDGEAHGVLALTKPGGTGRLLYTVRAPGNYVVVVDNRDGGRAAAVHLRVTLDFAVPRGPAVTYLSPQRRLTVILVSFAVFFAIVIWAGRRLLRAVR